MARKTIFRAVKDKNYFSVHNEAFENEYLSWEAKGLLAYLMSRPKDWVVRNHDLIDRSTAGRKKVQRILRELKDAGYMRRFKERKDDGTFQWITEVYERRSLNPELGGEPVDVGGELTTPPKRGDGSTIPPKSTRGSSTRGEGGHVLSTESLSTESPNTERTPPPTPSPNGESPETREGQRLDAEELHQLHGEVLKTFQEETGLKPPFDEEQRKRWWWEPIGEICVLADLDEELACTLMYEAIHRNRERDLSIARPYSVMNSARAIVAERTLGDYVHPDWRKAEVSE